MTASAEDRLLAADYRVFGKPAKYTPPDGQPTTCTVRLLREGRPAATTPYSPLMVGAADVAIAGLVLLVRASEIAEPEANGVFVVTGGPTYRVGDAPLPHDADGDEWECSVSTGDSA